MNDAVDWIRCSQGDQVVYHVEFGLTKALVNGGNKREKTPVSSMAGQSSGASPEVKSESAF